MKRKYSKRRNSKKQSKKRYSRKKYSKKRYSKKRSLRGGTVCQPDDLLRVGMRRRTSLLPTTTRRAGRPLSDAQRAVRVRNRNQRRALSEAMNREPQPVPDPEPPADAEGAESIAIRENLRQAMSDAEEGLEIATPPETAENVQVAIQGAVREARRVGVRMPWLATLLLNLAGFGFCVTIRDGDHHLYSCPGGGEQEGYVPEGWYPAPGWWQDGDVLLDVIDEAKTCTEPMEPDEVEMLGARHATEPPNTCTKRYRCSMPCGSGWRGRPQSRWFGGYVDAEEGTYEGGQEYCCTPETDDGWSKDNTPVGAPT